MLSGALVAAAILTITALGFFIFPGHTYLQQDTQIYVPMAKAFFTRKRLRPPKMRG